MPKLNVLITRPQLKGKVLCQEVLASGNRAIAIPMLAISPITSTSIHDKILGCLKKYQKIILTSDNAVEYGMPMIYKHANPTDTPIQWFTIGSATALSLKLHGIDSEYCPYNPTSESLLNIMPLKNIKNQQILILKGKDGRKKLEQQLRHRGALVTTVDVYERIKIHYESEQIIKIFLHNNINVIVITSSESLINLRSLLSDAACQQLQLFNITLIVPSNRVAEISRSIGFNSIIISSGASNQSILASLQKL